MYFIKSYSRKQNVRKITRNEFLNNKYLKKHKDKIAKPCLWDKKREHIAMGAMIGGFSSLLPMPFQMFLATPLCVIFCGNIPVAISLVWVSNPITMPFIMFAQYLLGNFILGEDNSGVSEENIIEMVKNGIEPLLVGSIVSAVVVSLALYVAIWLFYWFLAKKN